MRLFIALELESPFFKDLQSHLYNSGAKLSLPDSFHLTLKFLDEVPESHVGRLIERLKAVQWDTIAFETNGLGFFPDKAKPRVIWIGLHPAQGIRELQQRIDRALTGMFRDESDFKPHITLARVKDILDKPRFDATMNTIAGITAAHPLSFQKDAFYLIQSDLSLGKPVYRVVERFSSS